MAETVQCTCYTDWDPISEVASPIAATDLDGHEYLSDAAARLDRLDAQATSIKGSLLRVKVYLNVGDAKIRQRTIEACLAAGLLNTPIERLADEVERVLAEVLREAQIPPGLNQTSSTLLRNSAATSTSDSPAAWLRTGSWVHLRTKSSE
jgi:hypothetical protein